MTFKSVKVLLLVSVMLIGFAFNRVCDFVSDVAHELKHQKKHD